jgi:hypothetical protein
MRRSGLLIAILGTGAIAAGVAALVVGSRGSKSVGHNAAAAALSAPSTVEDPSRAPTPIVLDPLIARGGKPPADKAESSSVPPAESASPVATRPDTVAEPAARADTPTARAPKAPEAQGAHPPEAQGSRSPVRRGDTDSTFVEINKVVRAHLAAIKKQCWEPAYAARGPDAPSSSKVVVSLNISPEGKVQSTDVSGGDGFGSLASCVQTQAANLHFPASNEGAAVSVPFVFAAQ